MGNENILNDEIYCILEKVNLLNDISDLKDGIDTIIGKSGYALSGGQAQKLSLARLFLNKECQFIILDEPTSALDKESENIIISNIVREKKNASILMITHREEIIKYCNSIIELRNKKLVATYLETDRSSDADITNHKKLMTPHALL